MTTELIAELTLTAGEMALLEKKGHIKINDSQRGEIDIWMLFDEGEPGVGKRLRVKVTRAGVALQGLRDEHGD